MNRTGASGGMQGHECRYLKMARMLIGGNRREFTSNELKIARHMAQEGASIAEIKAALGWDHMTLQSFTRRLSKLNIRSRRTAKGIRGHLSGDPHFDGLRNTRVSGKSYRPKAVT